jgi:hypothetical protein
MVFQHGPTGSIGGKCGPAFKFPQRLRPGRSHSRRPIVQTHPGRVFWVSNASTLLANQRGGSDGNKGTFNEPFSTLNYAVTQCVANRGDVIIVKPGHAENISSAPAR